MVAIALRPHLYSLSRTTPDGKMIRLLPAEDAHFDWMLSQHDSSFHGLTLPPGGVDEPFVLELLRAVAADLLDRHGRGSWLAVNLDEVVGLCGYKRPPSTDGVVEIGYGIAVSRQGRGFGSRALVSLLLEIEKDHFVRIVVAETGVNNLASQRVLEKNGFAPVGFRDDVDDGALIIWRRSLVRSSFETGSP